jgi:ASC-1-like (ASCH) protein
MKNHSLDFREVNRDTFDLICSGGKSIETRAAVDKYADIAEGDTIIFSCGVDTCTKKVLTVEKFPSINAIFEKYTPQEINPTWKSEQDGRDAWESFPNYTEKIEKFGLIALTLKK